MKEYKDMFLRVVQILVPILLSILIPLIARVGSKRKIRRIRENLKELRKHLPGDTYTTQEGTPYFKGRYGPHNIEISFEGKKNTLSSDVQITMGLSSGFPVKIYNRKLMPLKDSLKTGVSYINNSFTVVSPSSEQAKSLILSISRDDIRALNNFLKAGIVIDEEKITLMKRNAGPKDTEPQRLLSILDVTSRIARVVERLAPLKTSLY